MNYFIIGLGAIGYSFLKLLKEDSIDINKVYLIERDIHLKEKFVSLGFLENNFYNITIDASNYLSILEMIHEDDFLFDFSSDLKNLSILKYCLDNDIHYLSTADSSWINDLSWFSDHQHFLEYLKLKKQYKSNISTSIVLFGMNPGLISIFVKKGIEYIIENDNSLYIKRHREDLKKLINEKKYNQVAKLLKIEYIQEVDFDNQEFNVEYQNDTIYSPWNVIAFASET